MEVAVKKGIARTEHCSFCGGNTSTGCLNPEHSGMGLSECPVKNNPALGVR